MKLLICYMVLARWKEIILARSRLTVCRAHASPRERDILATFQHGFP